MKKFMIALAVLVPIGLIGLLVFALIGPKSDPIITKELIGKYSVPLPDGGKEILELLANGTCEQDILLKDGTAYHAIGKWQHDVIHEKLDSYDYLSLEGTRIPLAQFDNKINPNITEIPKGGTGGLPITRTLMGHIIIQSDKNSYFQKEEK